MRGKYRPIGVAEKRAMLEAAGEEWPIGSDGLPKVWRSATDRLSGGSWAQRSSTKTEAIITKRLDRGRKIKGRVSLIGLPAMSFSEAGKRGVNARDLRRLESNKGTLRVVHSNDPKALKLIELMFDERAPAPEREAAKLALRKRRNEWLLQRTTSAETESTLAETKSPLALASSQGG